MFNILFEYYNLSNYDTRPGSGVTLKPNKKTLGLTSGDARPIYINTSEEEEEEDDLIIDSETLDAVGKKLYQPVYSVDPKRSDLSNTSGSRRMSPGLNELHTNPARKNSIAPFKMRKFDGPPIGTGNASKIFKTGPGRKSGTVYGFSKAPIEIDDDPLFFDGEIKDKMERSLIKHQKKIMKIKKMINNIEKS